MNIKEQVYQAIHSSPGALFAEDVSHRIPAAKLSTIRSACFELLKEGRLLAKRKNRQDGRLQAIFYCLDAQLRGLEGLMDYERVTRGVRTNGPKPGDVLIAVPIGPKGTETLTLAQAKALYEGLKSLFEPKGGK